MTATPRKRPCPGCGNLFDSKRYRRRCWDCLEASRLRDRERTRAWAEKKRALKGAEVTGHTCVSCFKPTTYFYVVEGSSKYYMTILNKELGIPLDDALAMAATEQVLPGTVRMDGPILRKVYTCVTCAARRHLVPPVNEVDLELMAEDGSQSPMRAAVFTEDISKSVFSTGPEVLRQRSEDEMRAKGAHKDIADYLDKLVERGYLWVTGGSNHYTITREGYPMWRTSISSTPKNAARAVLNTESKIRQFERVNHLSTVPHRKEKDSAEDYAKLMTQRPAPNAPEEDRSSVRGPLTGGVGADNLERLASLRPVIEERRYNVRSTKEKVALIYRYDKLSLDGQRELLAKEKIRHETIRRWRKEPDVKNWIPDEPVVAEVVTMVEEEPQVPESQVHKQQVVSATFSNADVRPAIPSPAQVAASTMHTEPDDDTAALMKLMARKRYITSRLEIIDAEKAALVRKLDEEKAALTRELGQVQDDLLAVIA